MKEIAKVHCSKQLLTSRAGESRPARTPPPDASSINRGSARAQCEDCAAVAAGAAEVLSHADWAGRAGMPETTGTLSVQGGRAFALSVDGHGGQVASRHAADVLPGLLADGLPVASALRNAWLRSFPCANDGRREAGYRHTHATGCRWITHRPLVASRSVEHDVPIQ